MYKKVLTLYLMFSLVAVSVFAASLTKTVEQGNLHYNKAEYDQALNRYRDGQIQSPEQAELHFNIGDALFKKKDYAGAMEAYNKAISASDDATLHSKAFYNLGNCLFRAGQDSVQLQNGQGAINSWTQSIDSYKKALQTNPDDKEAKFNLEYVRKILKEMADKQKQDPQQQQQQKGQQQQQQQGQQGQQDQNQQDKQQQQEQQAQAGQDQKKQDQEKQKQDQQSKDEEKPPEQGQEQGRVEGEISKEDAERMLDALKAAEKEEQKDQQKKKIKASGRVSGKQW